MSDIELTAHERWMVKSNVKAIKAVRATASEGNKFGAAERRIATLRANGYFRVADAVEAELEGGD